MLFGLQPAQLLLVVLIGVAAGGVVLALALPLLSSGQPDLRARALAAGRRAPAPRKASALDSLLGRNKDSRRSRVLASLRVNEERAGAKRQGPTLRLQLARAGLKLAPGNLLMISAAVGLVVSLLPWLFGFSWYLGILTGMIGFLGLPRWFLGNLARRRQKAFRENLADAVEVMVRGLKAGLPITDAMRVIATEAEPPVGPEFMEVVEGQRVGITLEQGLERMFERVPLPEVSFLSILLSIQAKSGGNLSETLANLAKVLRDRKKMDAKVRSMSQEARSSAAIIGSLPFLIVGALMFINPGYLEPLWKTEAGHIMLAFCGVWMVTGLLVMRAMVNFEV